MNTESVLQRLVYAVTRVKPKRQCYGQTMAGQTLLLYPEGWHISKSHSGYREVAVVSRRPVGVDIEQVRPVHPALARRVFTEDERLSVERSKDPDREYTRLWTVRESFAKCTGEGLRGVKAYAEKPLPFGYVWRSEYKDGYVITVCREKM